jgi:hypothetical protein
MFTRRVLLHHDGSYLNSRVAALFWEGYELLHADTRDIYRLACRKAVLADDLQVWDEADAAEKVSKLRLMRHDPVYQWECLGCVFLELAGTQINEECSI